MALLPETKLRNYVNLHMKHIWNFTWHEDREISPGVPDLHYVMTGEPGEQFRVGWIELKAIDTRLTLSQRIKVEPSQHQYLRRWCPHMPIHFMVRIQTRIYIIPGESSKELSACRSEDDARIISVLHFEQAELATVLPPFLREITRI